MKNLSTPTTCQSSLSSAAPQLLPAPGLVWAPATTKQDWTECLTLVYVKTTFAYLGGVEPVLLVVQAVLGCQDVERIEDTPATHVLTRSEIHLT